jgi:hypothetical protein
LAQERDAAPEHDSSAQAGDSQSATPVEPAEPVPEQRDDEPEPPKQHGNAWFVWLALGAFGIAVLSLYRHHIRTKEFASAQSKATEGMAVREPPPPPVIKVVTKRGPGVLTLRDPEKAVRWSIRIHATRGERRVGLVWRDPNGPKARLRRYS